MLGRWAAGLIFVPGTEVEFAANICDDAVNMLRKFIIVPGTKRDTMQYKNPHHKKRKNTHALEVSCGKCKKPVAIYQKAGKGNLIKMLVSRVVEAEVDLENLEGHLSCPQCGLELARKGKHENKLAFWIIRGKINYKRLDNYPL